MLKRENTSDGQALQDKAARLYFYFSGLLLMMLSANTLLAPVYEGPGVSLKYFGIVSIFLIGLLSFIVGCRYRSHSRIIWACALAIIIIEGTFNIIRIIFPAEGSPIAHFIWFVILAGIGYRLIKARTSYIGN